jgi:DNA-directed RNA polymerase specialized sigma24 family protein
MADLPHTSRRLTKDEIKQLIQAHINDVSNGDIAIMLTIDTSTVRYPLVDTGKRSGLMVVAW